MADMVIGTGTIRLQTDASGVSKGVSDAERTVEKSGGKAGTSWGTKFGGAVSKLAKGGAAAAALAVGTTLVKGFTRLKAIDDARAKLEGLGHSAKQVDGIMENALASVKGTAFGMGDAASQAAVLVASGVKPGKDLTKTLTLVGDAATIAGTSLGDMGDVFSDVAANGGVTTDALNRLEQRGIPATELLAKSMKLTRADVRKMATEGTIDFDQFQKAMDAGLGGAAKKSGKTFSGALQNVGAAMSRLGASLLGGVFAQLPKLFGKLIGWLDKIGPAATSIGENIGKVFGDIAKALMGFDWGKIVTALQPLLSALADFGSKVGQAAVVAGPALKQIAVWLAPLLGAAAAVAVMALTKAFELLGPAILGIATALAATVGFIQENQTLFQALGLLITGLLLPAITMFTLQMGIAAVAAIASWVSMAATALASAASIAFAWIMAFGPIGLIIGGVIGLIAVIVLLWKKSETFRAIVTGVWTAIKTAVMSVLDWFKGPFKAFFTSTLPSFFSASWERVKGIARTALKVLLILIGGWPALVFAIIRRFGPGLVAIFRNAFDAVRGVVANGLSNIRSVLAGIPGIISGIAGRVLSAAKTLGSNIIGGILSGLQGVGGIVGSLASAIKSAINSALGLPITIKGPGPLPDFHIDAFASGTDFAPGGVAWVGEKGPELVNLPRGSRVHSASESRQMAGGKMPDRLVLRVGARDFIAYIEEIADQRIDASDSLSWQGA